MTLLFFEVFAFQIDTFLLESIFEAFFSTLRLNLRNQNMKCFNNCFRRLKSLTMHFIFNASEQKKSLNDKSDEYGQ